jgi:aminoglycoside phosphotransferase (APT) family kinase protein
MVLAKEGDVLRASLRRMGLIEDGEVAQLTALTGGVSSQIVLADTARGPVCIKRALPKLNVAAEWNAPVERNGAEVAWMKLAAEVVPGAVPGILGEDSEAHAFAMAYMEPDSHPVWKKQLRDGVADIETASAVAKILVGIHRATARNETLARQFDYGLNFHALRLEPYFASAAVANPDCAGALRQLIEMESTTKLALIHGDVSPKNILTGPAGPVLLDAECATYGDPAFDLAFCLTHLLLKCLWRAQYAAAYLRCFDAMVSSYLAQVSWEPAEELERRAAWLLPAMLLARVDGKSPVEYLPGGAVRTRVRKFAKPFVIEPARQLATIRTTWSKEQP